MSSSSVSDSMQIYLSQIYNGVLSRVEGIFGKSTSLKIENFINAGKVFVDEHALNLGYASAALGGLTVVDATIKVLQIKGDSKSEISPFNETVRILYGSALIAIGINYCASNAFEKAQTLNFALAAGLANAVWRTTMVVNPTVLKFVIKTDKTNDTIKKITYHPENYINQRGLIEFNQ